jgi:hypothetical protein
VADYTGALEDCEAVLATQQATATADALLLALLTRAQCRAGLGHWRGVRRPVRPVWRPF